MMESAGWNDQGHAMHPGADDDFQQFLNMNSMDSLSEGLQFDFGDFQNPNGGNMMQVAHRETLDTPMSGTNGSVLMSTAMHNQMHPMSTAPPNSTIPSNIMSTAASVNAISDIDAQIQFLQQQKLQQQQRQLEEQQAAFFAQQQSRMVPPTPQSLEIQAGNHQFYTTQPDRATQQQQHQDMFERFQRMKEQQQQDMSFTPLVSPAVTPLESQFPMDQAFTVPNAYFSPLTSPALHAQSDPIVMFEHGLSNANTTTSSPEGMDLEANPPPSSGPVSNDLAKKGRKANAAKTRSRGSVGKSPITKPQRKKTGSTPLMNAQTLSELTEQADKPAELQPRPSKKTRQMEQSGFASNSSTAGITDSENDSVSPEALSEMPPPPLPKTRSAKPSPCIQPQNNATPTMAPTAAPQPTGKPSPATPASLMRLPSPNNANKSSTLAGSDPMASENIENFELPESVSANTFKKPNLAPLSTQSPQIRSPAPETAPGTASSFQPLPSPIFAKPGAAASASQSPQLTPGSSATTPNPRKTPQLAPRSGKKRASISSSHVSPALRPRISPSIKPLLPGGLRAEDSASQLLASKSNYQNILEGNMVPGVSYPSELSTNLTSKRTSHKIAEQGRRNRINSALQEIATLLPGGVIPEGKDSGAESGDKKDSKGGGGPNSKASTVELAIDYIKLLKQQVDEANKRAELAEKKLQEKEGAVTS
ncbi:phosphorus acquisition-controlling protein [Diaporthe amygdali]|uniref:phosphorus acquisition-controlling protein n=1 Tax=Phomopsis amygdali TaxID=1214568 RepID=UPI0022FE1F61|nr:phosphorus acquisition-controlling protein [Diaporthe amygdali]KAJ0121693.1 phosphorus acquisition-controlling protein [Diaporthe amygdali]